MTTLPPLASYDDVCAILDRKIEEDARVTRLLEMASGVARSYMGQVITAVTNDVVTVMPDDREILWLPQRPVTGVTSVAFGATIYAASAWELMTDGGIRSAWGRPWRFVALNASGLPIELTVTYSHGYATVPDDIVTVVAQMVGDVVQRSWRSNPVEGQPTPSAGMGLNLNRMQKTVLSRYKQTLSSVDIRTPHAPAYNW